MNDQTRAFLNDLTELFKKHNITSMVPVDGDNDEGAGYIRFYVGTIGDNFSLGDFNYGTFHGILTKTESYSYNYDTNV